ncbi:MAG: hypothetical protein GY789_08480 [Hyphomicrobiales bacterium]|nr:hypothetical protein [Hyphomicrobiales bacterium]MCP4997726.1 hypothetical protein [Hyphomicrobiales bacterium]
MSSEQTQLGSHPNRGEKDALSQKLDAIGWALFLIWVGIASLADIGWGWGLLGVAAIILGETAFRWNLDLNIEGFWVVVGLMFLAGGLWELFQVSWPLAPFLIIGCGLTVLWGVLRGKHLMKK